MLLIVLLAVRWLLGLVFWSSGVAKLADQPGTRAATRSYGLPARLANPISWALVSAEVGLALGLTVGVALPVTGLMAAVLLVAFAAAMERSLTLGRRFPCGCGVGVADRDIGWLLVVRNVVLAGVSVAVAVVLSLIHI